MSFPKDVIIMDYAWNRDVNKGYRLKDWYEIERWIFNE
jgi:5'(3')-deoxyribonucleotidase